MTVFYTSSDGSTAFDSKNGLAVTGVGATGPWKTVGRFMTGPGPSGPGPGDELRIVMHEAGATVTGDSIEVLLTPTPGGGESFKIPTFKAPIRISGANAAGFVDGTIANIDASLVDGGGEDFFSLRAAYYIFRNLSIIGSGGAPDTGWDYLSNQAGTDFNAHNDGGINGGRAIIIINCRTQDMDRGINFGNNLNLTCINCFGVNANTSHFQGDAGPSPAVGWQKLVCYACHGDGGAQEVSANYDFVGLTCNCIGRDSKTFGNIRGSGLYLFNTIHNSLTNGIDFNEAGGMSINNIFSRNGTGTTPHAAVNQLAFGQFGTAVNISLGDVFGTGPVANKNVTQGVTVIGATSVGIDPFLNANVSAKDPTPASEGNFNFNRSGGVGIGSGGARDILDSAFPTLWFNDGLTGGGTAATGTINIQSFKDPGALESKKPQGVRIQ